MWAKRKPKFQSHFLSPGAFSLLENSQNLLWKSRIPLLKNYHRRGILTISFVDFLDGRGICLAVFEFRFCFGFLWIEWEFFDWIELDEVELPQKSDFTISFVDFLSRSAGNFHSQTAEVFVLSCLSSVFVFVFVFVSSELTVNLLVGLN